MDNNLLRDKSSASYVEPVIFRVNKVSHPCFIDILLDCVREMCDKGTTCIAIYGKEYSLASKQ